VAGMTALRAGGVMAVATTALAAGGLLLDPQALRQGGILGLIGVALAQAFCLLLLWRGPVSLRAAAPAAVRAGAVVGAVAGALYGLEGLSEYLSASVTNASVVIGRVIVGGLVLANIIAGVLGVRRTGTVRGGITAAVYCAITEYLVWYPTVLICYYAFHGSRQLDRVWRAEGVYDDFARSGMTDIRAFVLQDFWGAGFFHLAAGLVIAGVFGTLAALVARMLWRGRAARTAEVEA